MPDGDAPIEVHTSLMCISILRSVAVPELDCIECKLQVVIASCQS